MSDFSEYGDDGDASVALRKQPHLALPGRLH
jgi:hypothetical protein